MAPESNASWADYFDLASTMWRAHGLRDISASYGRRKHTGPRICGIGGRGGNIHARAPINNARIKCIPPPPPPPASPVRALLLHSVDLKMQVAEHNGAIEARRAANIRSLSRSHVSVSYDGTIGRRTLRAVGKTNFKAEKIQFGIARIPREFDREAFYDEFLIEVDKVLASSFVDAYGNDTCVPFVTTRESVRN